MATTVSNIELSSNSQNLQWIIFLLQQEFVDEAIGELVMKAEETPGSTQSLTWGTGESSVTVECTLVEQSWEMQILHQDTLCAKVSFDLQLNSGETALDSYIDGTSKVLSQLQKEEALKPLMDAARSSS